MLLLYIILPKINIRYRFNGHNLHALRLVFELFYGKKNTYRYNMVVYTTYCEYKMCHLQDYLCFFVPRATVVRTIKICSSPSCRNKRRLKRSVPPPPSNHTDYVYDICPYNDGTSRIVTSMLPSYNFQTDIYKNKTILYNFLPVLKRRKTLVSLNTNYRSITYNVFFSFTKPHQLHVDVADAISIYTRTYVYLYIFTLLLLILLYYLYYHADTEQIHDNLYLL